MEHYLCVENIDTNTCYCVKTFFIHNNYLRYAFELGYPISRDMEVLSGFTLKHNISLNIKL